MQPQWIPELTKNQRKKIRKRNAKDKQSLQNEISLTDHDRTLINEVKALPGAENSTLQKFNGIPPKV